MIDFFQALGSTIMTPLYYATSFVMTMFHSLFIDVFGNGPAGQGVSWALSIVGLTIVTRIVLIPLFVKQIKSSRNMQLLQPKVKELQKKYGHDRERLSKETMALYRETGTNPFASCLPLILQMPIFIALFRLISEASRPGYEQHGVLTKGHAAQLQEATLFGAKLSEHFLASGALLNTRVLAVILIVTMSATTFFTQRQLMSKNMPPEAMSGPFAQQQKMLLYVLPLVFAVGGVAFPIGVLCYWTTSNAWTMAQQFYVIRRNPAPGTPAFEARQERMKRKGKGGADEEAKPESAPEAPAPPKRAQPKRQPRSQRSQSKSGSGQSKPASGQPAEKAGGQPKEQASDVEAKAPQDGEPARGASASGDGAAQRKPGTGGTQRKSGAGAAQRKSGGGSKSKSTGGGASKSKRKRSKGKAR